MGQMPVAEMRFAIQGLNPHASHQRRDVPSPNHLALLPQEITQQARTGKRVTQMEFVHSPHQGQRCSGYRRGLGSPRWTARPSAAGRVEELGG